MTRFVKEMSVLGVTCPPKPLEGRIQMGSKTWQVLIIQMPHTKFGLNRPGSFGDVFVKLSRRDNLITHIEVDLLCHTVTSFPPPLFSLLTFQRISISLYFRKPPSKERRPKPVSWKHQIFLRKRQVAVFYQTNNFRNSFYFSTTISVSRNDENSEQNRI